MELLYYKYQAVRKDGRTIKGKIESINRATSIRLLESKGYKIKSLEEINSFWLKINIHVGGTIFSQRQLIFFLRQLGSLLKAGVKLIVAMELLALQQENRQLRKLYFEIYYDIYSGYSFSKALRQKPKEFPPLLLQMVEVGEVSGDLTNTLIQMASYYENQFRISTEIKNAMRMPIIYLVATLLIAIGMLTFVFPNITGIYSSFENAKIPYVTQLFLDLGLFFAQNILSIVAGIILFIVIFYLFNRFSTKFKRVVTIFLLKIPIFGQLIQMNNQIMIANALSQMLSNGIHSMKALELLKKHTKNVIYQELIHKTQAYIEDGHPFYRAFEESDYIDPVMAKMIQTGEQSGDIPKVMMNLSDYYNGISDLRVNQLKNSIQPILLIIVYGIVGFMILAIMLPMLTLGSQI
jgi:type IV pilus assembly protein PilC